MSSFTPRKEWILIVAVIFAVGYASYDLISEQRDNSEILNSGTMIDPVTISGRAACEVPIPDISNRSRSDSLLNQEKEFFN